MNILIAGSILSTDQNVELIISNYQNYQLNKNTKCLCSSFKLKFENLFTIQFLQNQVGSSILSTMERSIKGHTLYNSVSS